MNLRRKSKVWLRRRWPVRPEPGATARLARLAVSFAVILGFWAAGELVAARGGLPVPGSVVGMLLLTAALRLRLMPAALVLAAAEPLIRYMALFFVPPGVAVLLYLDLLRQQWPILAIATLFSLFTVVLTVGLLQQRLEGDG